MFFNSKETIFRVINVGKLDTVFRRVILCFCVFLIINSLFFVVVRYNSQIPLQTPAEQPLKHKLSTQISHKPKTSFKIKINMLCRTMLKVILKEFVHSSPVSAEAEIEEVVKKVEYIYCDNPFRSPTRFSLFTFGENTSFIYTDSFPDILTPPPKRLV